MTLTRRQAFLILLMLYIIWHFRTISCAPHRPNLYYSTNPKTSFILRNCRSLHSKYHPLLLFYGAYPQLILGYFIGMLYPKLFNPNFEREIFTLSDGQQIPMDWIIPHSFKSNALHKPIVIGLYGIAGDKHSLNILRYCKLLSHRLGYGSVILGRRGHEVDIPLTVPKMSAFGLQQDLHECLLYIHSKYPSNPFILLGDSAGTGFWVRYVGDLAVCCNANFWRKMKQKMEREMEQRSPSSYKDAATIHNKIRCAVLISPGYDVIASLQNTPWIGQQIVLSLMKTTFVRNHFHFLKQHHESVITQCDETNDLLTFFRTYFGALSGYKSYEEWTKATNPTETFEFMQCPALVINARDDPICTAKTMDQWKWLFTEKDVCPNSILCETQYGSHCAFLSTFGGFWLDKVILEYVQTIDNLVSKERFHGD